MAWLKMETSTPEKAEVLAITARMGWDDPDLTVGKLFRAWRWFDQQTIDGNAVGVTAALLDRVVGVTGFCDAMREVGWLEVTEAGIRLPNFDRHNGETAKARALTAKRVAQHKSNAKANAKGNAATVTEALPREEKRREESRGAASRASRLSPEWTPSAADLEFIAKERPDLDASSTAARFRDFWVAKAGKDATKADWGATWRNWVRNENRGASTPRAPNPFEGAIREA